MSKIKILGLTKTADQSPDGAKKVASKHAKTLKRIQPLILDAGFDKKSHRLANQARDLVLKAMRILQTLSK